MKYIYLNRESAKKGVTLVLLVSEEKKNNYKEYFEDDAVEFIGEDVPHFISYDEETDSLREATEEEKLARGQRQLYENEALIEGKITEYDLYNQKVVNGAVVDKIREDFIEEGIITLEREKELARYQREKEFNALDILDAKVAVGRDALTTEEKENINTWYTTWKEIPNNYTDIKISIEELYPERPHKVDYYYKGE